jgi:hypothetical protein
MIVLCDPAGMVPVPDAAGVELVALAEALVSPRTSFESAFRTMKKRYPAMTYSPAPLPGQYHRRRRA